MSEIKHLKIEDLPTSHKCEHAYLGTNCMFMEHPFGLPFLEGIQKASKPLYMGIVAFAQSVCMFCVCYEAYRHLAKRFAPDNACTERSVV